MKLQPRFSGYGTSSDPDISLAVELSRTGMKISILSALCYLAGKGVVLQFAVGLVGGGFSLAETEVGFSLPRLCCLLF